MFERLADVTPDPVGVIIDGAPFEARAGDTVAAALLAAGAYDCRTTAISGAARGPYCLMGACFDCLVTIDDRPNQRGCAIRVVSGMRIAIQRGARSVPAGPGGEAAADPGCASTQPGAMNTAGQAAANGGPRATFPVSALDVAIIGAGPAGLAAATTCAALGLRACVFDEQPGPGGQIYRGITKTALPDLRVLGDEYLRGAAVVRAFTASGAGYVAEASVWSAARRGESGWELAVSIGPPDAREVRIVTAPTLILATGAQERPFAIPGWTLPGVLTAGAAQILLKSSALVPRGRTVLAGSGPLLWLLASQYLQAGVAVDALLDTTPRGRMAQVLRHAPSFLLSDYFARGRELVRMVRGQIPVIPHVRAIAAEGVGSVERVHATTREGVRTLAVDQLLLHQGVMPNVNFASAIGCTLRWNDAQACFAPVVDEWGGSSEPGVFIAGDGADIAGARAAESRGHLAAIAAANTQGRIDGSTRDRAALPHRQALARALRGRHFLDLLYRPADAFRLPTGDTAVCRCEEVTAADVRAAAIAGCVGPNQMKAYLRCGMGPCQGRQCAVTVTELIAQARGVSAGDAGCYRSRFPVQPVTLRELAALPASEDARRAVIRSET